MKKIGRLKDRFRGCMLGEAVGDALGGPFEGLKGEEVRERFKGEMVGGGTHSLRPGEYTDDAGMTLALAESLVERKEVALDDIVSKFVAWFSSDPKGVGRLTSTVLEGLSKGVPWRDAARTAWEGSGRKSAGNGSLMRFAPVALFDYNSRKRLMNDASAVSELTHCDPRCSEACRAASLMLVELIDGSRPADAISSTASVLGECEVSEVLEMSLDATPEDLKPTGYVLDTLEVACWSIARHATFCACVEGCIRLGGDTDTNAAVVGALAGARFGAIDIPERWVRALDANEKGSKVIVGLADELCRIATKRSR